MMNDVLFSGTRSDNNDKLIPNLYKTVIGAIFVQYTLPGTSQLKLTSSCYLCDYASTARPVSSCYKSSSYTCIALQKIINQAHKT